MGPARPLASVLAAGTADAKLGAQMPNSVLSHTGVTRAERSVCKTVGSAYVGSNPTPATTCENAPLAANSRASGAFLLCPGVCHLVTLWGVVLRCPRTHGGRESGPGSGAGNRRLCTDGHGRGAQARTSLRTGAAGT